MILIREGWWDGPLSHRRRQWHVSPLIFPLFSPRNINHMPKKLTFLARKFWDGSKFEEKLNSSHLNIFELKKVTSKSHAYAGTCRYLRWWPFEPSHNHSRNINILLASSPVEDSPLARLRRGLKVNTYISIPTWKQYRNETYQLMVHPNLLQLEGNCFPKGDRQ